jgi:hypothetical protein
LAGDTKHGVKGHKEARAGGQSLYKGGISVLPFSPDLYEIPISRLSRSSRIHMPCASTFQLHRARSSEMLDIIMLAIGLGFFALSIGYVYACDRL